MHSTFKTFVALSARAKLTALYIESDDVPLSFSPNSLGGQAGLADTDINQQRLIGKISAKPRPGRGASFDFCFHVFISSKA